jgi:hypothetical protein
MKTYTKLKDGFVDISDNSAVSFRLHQGILRELLHYMPNQEIVYMAKVLAVKFHDRVYILENCRYKYTTDGTVDRIAMHRDLLEQQFITFTREDLDQWSYFFADIRQMVHLGEKLKLYVDLDQEWMHRTDYVVASF